MRWSVDRLYRNRKALLIISGLVIPLLLSLLLLPEKTFIARILQDVFYSPFWAMSNRVNSLLDVYEENVTLSVEVARLKYERLAYEADRVEDERFRAMINALPHESYRFIPADVVAYDPGRRYSAITIKAAEDIRRFRAVVDENGVVGKTSSTTGTTANVSLLIGPNCRVAARDKATQSLGIVKWNSGRGLIFDDVAVEAEVAVGDTIISSGMGGVFPEGLNLGIITGITTPTSAFFKQINVKPAVDFSSLDNVIVMEPIATEQDK